MRRIFVCWSPQTYASTVQRLKAIDAVVKRHPAVGWKLLVGLAPRFHDVSEPSPLPDWRDFTPDIREEITWPALARAAEEIGKRLLEEASKSSARWCTLLDLWANFDPSWRGNASKRLNNFVRALKNPAEIEAMWDKLRKLVQKHRSFADAAWAMSEEDLKPLESILQTLQPKDLEGRLRWLFRPNSTLYSKDVPWEVLQAETEAAQLSAAEELLAELSLEKLVDFVQTITLHSALGFAIAKASVSDALKQKLLKLGLISENGGESDLAKAMLFVMCKQRGEGFARDLWQTAINEGWGERAELRIVQALPVNAATWQSIAARSTSLEQSYWKNIPTHWLPQEPNLEAIVEKLIAVNRSRDAVRWLGHRISGESSGKLLVRALRAAARTEPEIDSNDVTMFGHYVGVILDRLENDPSVGEDIIVKLQWSYFQTLRYSQRRPHILHRALARHPEFFVDLIKLIFLPAADSGVEEPPAENAERLQAAASHAYDVLRDWSHVPGADDSGLVDPDALETWVKKARKLLAEAGRGEIGDQKIGEILSAAVRQPDEPWPPEPVREILEITRSPAIEKGFEIGVYNRRGVTMRLPFDGGKQERGLAETYRKDAEALRFDRVRTAACLDRIAEGFERDAKRHDERAEQRDWD